MARNEIWQRGLEDCESSCYGQCTRIPQLVYKILSSPQFLQVEDNAQSANVEEVNEFTGGSSMIGLTVEHYP